MIQLELTELEMPKTMGDKEEKESKIGIPIDLIGIMREYGENHTRIYLRGGHEYVTIKESLGEVKEKINTLMAAQQVMAQAIAAQVGSKIQV